MTMVTIVTFAIAAALAGNAASEEGDYVEVKVRGTLRSGMMAIGGETTGVTITARGITWELDFTRAPELGSRAESLDGKTVVVTGTLQGKSGVEIPNRTILTVRTMESPKPSPK